VVDGLEKEFAGRARVMRADFLSVAGRKLARRYRIDTVPGFVVLDTEGKVVFRRNGAGGVPLSDLRRAIESAL
jgi:thioredoxin-related protein